MDDELAILLVDIEGNLIDLGGKQPASRNDKMEGYNGRFHEAYEVFEEEVELWSAETGVNLKLKHVTEGEEDEVDGVKITRNIRTKVYATFGSKTDKAFYKLQLGNIRPAFNVINDSDDKLWKFQWRFE